MYLEKVTTGIGIEKRDYDEKKYYKLLNKEIYSGEQFLYSNETPLRRLN